MTIQQRTDAMYRFRDMTIEARTATTRETSVVKGMTPSHEEVSPGCISVEIVDRSTDIRRTIVLPREEAAEFFRGGLRLVRKLQREERA